MKVIFLDFDGVLNSEGSFLYEYNRRHRRRERHLKGQVMETLCNVCCANLQEILYRYPTAKIVLSTTWRELFDMDWLRKKLESYHVDSSKVIDKTPRDWGGNRGIEIQLWLNRHPEVTEYIIIDDNDWGIKDIHGAYRFVKTDDKEGGLNTKKMEEAMVKLSKKHQTMIKEMLEDEQKKKQEEDSKPEST